MISIARTIKETFSFFYNHFTPILSNLWLVITINLLFTYAFHIEYDILFSISDNRWIGNSIEALGALIFSPFYAHPLFNMIVKGRLERRNFLGIAWSMNDARYLFWNLLFLFPTLLSILLSHGATEAALAFERLSPEDPSYGTVALGICFLILLSTIVLCGVAFFVTRFLPKFFSFYDTTPLSFKESWGLTKKKTFKIFLANNAVYIGLLFVSHHIEETFLATFLEVFATLIQATASCVIYKKLKEI